jgi:hypothetical protein
MLVPTSLKSLSQEAKSTKNKPNKKVLKKELNFILNFENYYNIFL